MFFAIVHKDPDSAFGIWFPDVEGCFAAADDQADFLANAIEALSLQLEDQDAPTAREIHDLHEDPAVKESLAEGGYILSVPFVHGKTRRVG